MVISTEQVHSIYTEYSDSESVLQQRIIDEFPFDRVVYHTIETELTHPAGYGTLRNVYELSELIVSEWVESAIPRVDEIEDESVSEWLQSIRIGVVTETVEEVSETVRERVEEEYMACLSTWAEVDSDTSFSSLYEALEDVEQPSVSEAHSLVGGSV